MKPTEFLTNFVNKLRYDQIPSDVISYAKLLILDYIAAAMAGYKVNAVFNKAVYDVLGDMGGKPESTVMIYSMKMPATNAAFFNAVLSHGADMDDGNRKAQGHPAASIVSAVWALAETCGACGKDVITAVVAGYEIFVRISTAINPGHMQRGFHSTGTSGAIGAAAACAKLLGLSYEGIYNALSLAATQASGLLMVTESGQMAKPVNPARAAYTGVFSALLAKAGSEAPIDPLEGEKGYFHAFSDTLDLDILEKDLYKEFGVNSCYVKLYPSCRHTHSALDAALELRKNISSPDEIDKIIIKIYPAAIKIAGIISEPKNTDEAKFSIAFTAACAFVNGKFGLDDLNNPSACTQSIKDLVKKIELAADPSLENRDANIRGAKVEMILKDGRSFSSYVPLPKGDPEVPVTPEDMKNKLAACANGLFDEDVQLKILKAVDELETWESFNDFMKFFSQER